MPFFLMWGMSVIFFISRFTVILSFQDMIESYHQSIIQCLRNMNTVMNWQYIRVWNLALAMACCLSHCFFCNDISKRWLSFCNLDTGRIAPRTAAEVLSWWNFDCVLILHSLLPHLLPQFFNTLTSVSNYLHDWFLRIALHVWFRFPSLHQNTISESQNRTIAKHNRR